MENGNWPSAWLRGVIELAVLAIAAEGETYGYVVGARLAEGGLGSIRGGTLYPILNRLEDNGALTAQWRLGERGPARKFYLITEQGSARLEREREQWRAFSGKASSIIDPEGTAA